MRRGGEQERYRNIRAPEGIMKYTYDTRGAFVTRTTHIDLAQAFQHLIVRGESRNRHIYRVWNVGEKRAKQ